MNLLESPFFSTGRAEPYWATTELWQLRRADNQTRARAWERTRARSLGKFTNSSATTTTPTPWRWVYHSPFPTLHPPYIHDLSKPSVRVARTACRSRVSSRRGKTRAPVYNIFLSLLLLFRAFSLSMLFLALYQLRRLINRLTHITTLRFIY